MMSMIQSFIASILPIIQHVVCINASFNIMFVIACVLSFGIYLFKAQDLMVGGAAGMALLGTYVSDLSL